MNLFYKDYLASASREARTRLVLKKIWLDCKEELQALVPFLQQEGAIHLLDELPLVLEGARAALKEKRVAEDDLLSCLAGSLP